MQDITSWFKQACQEIPPGRMVKPPQLGMLEAMNAIQLMDPKMDTGLNRQQDASMCFDPDTPYSPEDLCKIMDELVALEIAWYSGATLVQTVLTSLHYHNPQHLAGPSSGHHTIQAVLRAYVLLYCKTIDLAYKELAKGHVMDGEDCWMDHYGISVHMADSIDDVLLVVDEVLDWLDYSNIPLRDQLSARLVARRDFLLYFDTTSLPPGQTDVQAMLDSLTHIEISDEPSSLTWPFASDMTAYLRQKGRDRFEGIVRMLAMVESLGQADISRWEDFFRSIAWSPEQPAIVRSLLKSKFSAECDRRNNVLIHHLFRDGDSMTLAEVRDIGTKNSLLGIWKDLVAAYAFATATTPLLNRARQRRSLLTLAAAWRERAATAHHHGLSQATQRLNAMRLNCLLEAALAAFDLDLITTAEESESWWWIHAISVESVRNTLPETWQYQWASMWIAISAAMQSLLSVRPLSTTQPLRSQFRLRHKRTLKTPKSANVLVPSYGERARCNETQAEPITATTHALERFRHAHGILSGLELSKATSTSGVLSTLQQNISHNVDILTEVGVNFAWTRSSRERKESRWILLLSV